MPAIGPRMVLPGSTLRTTDGHFGEISVLKRRGNRDEAQAMLTRISRYVLPLMRKRGWHVGSLIEFFPKNPSLLGINVNRGSTIKLRLRLASLPDTFLPFEGILDTMLHELAHNVRGPHDRQFFALWDELRDELSAMIARGFTGDQWLGSGQRLDMAPPGHRHSAEAVAVSRAMRPKAGLGRLGSGRSVGANRGPGDKLGGAKGEGDVRALALEAAERRIFAEKVCGNNESSVDGVNSASGHPERNPSSIIDSSVDSDSDSIEEISEAEYLSEARRKRMKLDPTLEIIDLLD